MEEGLSDEGYMVAAKTYFTAQSDNFLKKITKIILIRIQSPGVTIIVRKQTIHLAQDVVLLGALYLQL